MNPAFIIDSCKSRHNELIIDYSNNLFAII